MNKLFPGVVALAVMAASCNPSAPKQDAKADILAAHLDTTVRPNDDFFAYANGGWMKNNPIPNEETTFGVGELVQRELNEKLRHISEEAEKKGEKSGSGQQIGDFWHSAMDSAGIEKNGIEPLKAELDKIAAIKTPKDVMMQAAHMHTYGAGVFFGEGVGQDEKNSSVMAYGMQQGGLGMPSRDYYFNTDARAMKVRNAYPVFITRIFTNMGIDSVQAKKKAAAIIALETAMAKSSRKLEDLRDPYKNYNKFAISQLTKIAPHTEWPTYIAVIGVKNIDSVIVGQPEFYTALDKLINTTDVQTLKDYLTFHLISSFSSCLSKPYFDASFDFYNKTIRGQKEPRPRWRRALDAEQGAIGESLGQLFVKEYFTPKAKERYEQMVENVRSAYKNRIQKLDWMSDSTKQKAISKLNSIKKKVGYPDKWKDYSALKIDRGPYVLNMMRAGEWHNNYDLAKLGKPVDRNEWDMTPQTYNAYYNPSNNEIVLPAAMMSVPGFKDEELDDALVYGYTAASTIGHEITHGFDDQGRQFDEQGNLRNWWGIQDSVQFTKRAEVLVQQFNKMVPIDTLHVNGRATLGENLADLGGILIGLDAFKQTETYKKGEKVHGMTQLQRFFLGYSLGWLLAEKDEVISNQLLTDVHSPAKCRVNGPFPNVADFYEAFNIKPGDKMYIPDSLRVHLW